MLCPIRQFSYFIFFALSALTLTQLMGCSASSPVVYDRNASATDSASVSSSDYWKQTAQKVVSEVVKETVAKGVKSPEQLDEIAFETLIRTLAKEVEMNWGDRKSASRKEYVKYSNNYRTRVAVNFDQGKVRVETLDQKDLRHAIVVTLLTPDDPESVDLFSDKEVELGEEPVLYRQVLDNRGQPIRWSWRAGKYADYLIRNRMSRQNSAHGQVYAVEFNLVKDHMEKRQYQYATLVQKHSRKYRVDESLIYAIMRTESSFNPYAVSHANAYGLMQVVSGTAGRDVFQRIKKRNDSPSRNYLFNPHNNIDTGTAYIHILDTIYLKNIRDPLSRRYAVISAYNGGAGNVFRTFNRNRMRAVSDINTLTPAQVYWALTRRHPLSESRRYLEKVTRAEKDFHNGRI